MQVLRGEQDGTEFGGKYTPEPWQSCVVVQRTMSLSWSGVDATAAEANPTSAAESSHARIMRFVSCRFGVDRYARQSLQEGAALTSTTALCLCKGRRSGPDFLC